jgi:rhamnogalacturonyl hydrolase YesR
MLDRRAVVRLQAYIEATSFKGYDPYDALNSPILKTLSLDQKYLRIAFIQLLKRLPFNLRPLLGIKKDYNPKGLGLFLWGYAKLYKAEKKQEYLEKINRLLELLDKCKSEGYSGNSWGYNFDWQSRAFFLPKYTPTVVNSSFIGHALIDAYENTGIKEVLELAIPIKDFILNDLNRYKEDGTICFSYSPLDHYFVHNANLLGASLLIRIFGHTGERRLKDTALVSLAYSMNRQREDGSWPYAEREESHWIDSFHTGFNLQALKYFLDLGYSEEYRSQFNRGVKFYEQHFFLEDGTPKYFHDRVYPIDIHCPAQAVVFFSQMGPNYSSLAEKVLSWLIENMQDPKGYFYFQKTKFYTNKIPYIRWSQAWAFHALTEYYLHEKRA